MNVTHVYNSGERQQYLIEHHYSIRLKPRLLYAGKQFKSGGWEEKTHSHDFSEIVFVYDGHGEVTVGGITRNVSKGDIIIYNAGVSHSERSLDSSSFEVRFIAYDKLEITDLPPNHLLPPDYDFIYPTSDMYSTFVLYFDRIFTEFETKDQFFAEIAQILSRNMLLYLFRLINESGKESDILRNNKVLDRAVEYIDNNYKSEITLETLASKCFVNKYYLAHLFTRFKGISVGKYLNCKRFEEAKRLLAETAMPVGDVAVSSGFNDVSYFCRAFKKETGVTPLEYRKNPV